MTPKQVIEHDWQIGEKLYEVYHIPIDFQSETIFDTPSRLTKPEGIIEVQVVNIEKSFDPQTNFEYIQLTLDGNFSTLNDKVLIENTYLIAGIRPDKHYDEYYNEVCTRKFFTKKEAETQLDKETYFYNEQMELLKKADVSLNPYMVQDRI